MHQWSIDRCHCSWDISCSLDWEGIDFRYVNICCIIDGRDGCKCVNRSLVCSQLFSKQSSSSKFCNNCLSIIHHGPDWSASCRVEIDARFEVVVFKRICCCVCFSCKTTGDASIVLKFLSLVEDVLQSVEFIFTLCSSESTRCIGFSIGSETFVCASIPSLNSNCGAIISHICHGLVGSDLESSSFSFDVFSWLSSAVPECCTCYIWINKCLNQRSIGFSLSLERCCWGSRCQCVLDVKSCLTWNAWDFSAITNGDTMDDLDGCECVNCFLLCSQLVPNQSSSSKFFNNCLNSIHRSGDWNGGCLVEADFGREVVVLKWIRCCVCSSGRSTGDTSTSRKPFGLNEVDLQNGEIILTLCISVSTRCIGFSIGSLTFAWTSIPSLNSNCGAIISHICHGLVGSDLESSSFSFDVFSWLSSAVPECCTCYIWINKCLNQRSIGFSLSLERCCWGSRCQCVLDVKSCLTWNAWDFSAITNGDTMDDLDGCECVNCFLLCSQLVPNQSSSSKFFNNCLNSIHRSGDWNGGCLVEADFGREVVVLKWIRCCVCSSGRSTGDTSTSRKPFGLNEVDLQNGEIILTLCISVSTRCIGFSIGSLTFVWNSIASLNSNCGSIISDICHGLVGNELMSRSFSLDVFSFLSSAVPECCTCYIWINKCLNQRSIGFSLSLERCCWGSRCQCVLDVKSCLTWNAWDFSAITNGDTMDDLDGCECVNCFLLCSQLVPNQSSSSKFFNNCLNSIHRSGDWNGGCLVEADFGREVVVLKWIRCCVCSSGRSTGDTSTSRKPFGLNEVDLQNGEIILTLCISVSTRCIGFSIGSLTFAWTSIPSLNSNCGAISSHICHGLVRSDLESRSFSLDVFSFLSSAVPECWIVINKCLNQGYIGFSLSLVDACWVSRCQCVLDVKSCLTWNGWDFSVITSSDTIYDLNGCKCVNCSLLCSRLVPNQSSGSKFVNNCLNNMHPSGD